MNAAVKICKTMNKWFKLQVHPFNLNNSGVKSYAEWQYEKGVDTIKFYLNKTSAEAMFKDKDVLDIGCGAGGKTIYYASHGVKKIYGLEILEKYRIEAEKLAEKKGFLDKFEFICEDAAKMHFEDDSIDTIIMNDAMEHVDEPEKVLRECYRILKPAGKLYLNFPPYNHPYGAHLSDAISIPWVHCFFSDATLIQVYKDLVKELPDGKERVKFRISKNKDGKEYFSYINHMSIKRFDAILGNSSFRTFYYAQVPLRKQLALLAKLPILKEFFVKMVVTILEK